MPPFTFLLRKVTLPLFTVKLYGLKGDQSRRFFGSLIPDLSFISDSHVTTIAPSICAKRRLCLPLYLAPEGTLHHIHNG